MHKILKIKIVLLICLAFIFKLLFVNIGAFASLEPSSDKQVSAHHSFIFKKRIMYDTDAHVKPVYASEQLVQELTEENQESEDSGQFKKATFLFVLFSFLKGASVAPKLLVPFDRIKCQLQPKKFLALSVIRI
jgi:hypothetical protein